MEKSEFGEVGTARTVTTVNNNSEVADASGEAVSAIHVPPSANQK